MKIVSLHPKCLMPRIPVMNRIAKATSHRVDRRDKGKRGTVLSRRHEKRILSKALNVGYEDTSSRTRLRSDGGVVDKTLSIHHPTSPSTRCDRPRPIALGVKAPR